MKSNFQQSLVSHFFKVRAAVRISLQDRDFSDLEDGDVELLPENEYPTFADTGIVTGESGGVSLPWVILAVAGYCLYHLIATGAFQALTALGGVK